MVGAAEVTPSVASPFRRRVVGSCSFPRSPRSCACEGDTAGARCAAMCRVMSRTLAASGSGSTILDPASAATFHSPGIHEILVLRSRISCNQLATYWSSELLSEAMFLLSQWRMTSAHCCSSARLCVRATPAFPLGLSSCLSSRFLTVNSWVVYHEWEVPEPSTCCSLVWSGRKSRECSPGLGVPVERGKGIKPGVPGGGPIGRSFPPCELAKMPELELSMTPCSQAS